MSTAHSFTLETLSGAEVTDTMLEEAASLFSSAYGIWSVEAEHKMSKYCKPGHRIKMAPQRLRQLSLAPGTHSVLVRSIVAADDNKLAGYAFATLWNYKEHSVCWVTQLCVAPEYRRRGLATRLLSRLRETTTTTTTTDAPGDKAAAAATLFGILSSHSAAIMAALRAWAHGIENADFDVTKRYAGHVIEASPVDYVRDAKLRGSLFGTEEDGSVCCADTGFWVDHKEPLGVLEEVRKEKKGVKWPFGELPGGCEFLVVC